MSDHVAVPVDRLMAAAHPEYALREGHFGETPSIHTVIPSNDANEGWEVFPDEAEAAPIVKKECRICHEEDDVKNLVAPCACNGSMKMVHRACIQKWYNEKPDNICEICQQPYDAAYTAPRPPRPPTPPRIPSPEEIALSIRAEPVSPPLVVADAITTHLFDGNYDECATAQGARTACIRASVLFPLAFLLLKQSFDVLDMNDDSFLNVLTIFALRAMVFFAPLYMLLWFMHLWLRRRERVATATIKAEIARIIHANHVRMYQQAYGEEASGSEESPPQT